MPRLKSLEEIEARHNRQANVNDTPEGENTDTDTDTNTGGYNEPGDDEAQALADARREIEQVKQQMAAIQGRLTPAQQQGEEYRQLYTSERSERERERATLNEQIEALNARLNEVGQNTALEELLTDDERDMFDPAQIKVMAKLADSIAARRMPKVDIKAETLKALDERNAKQVLEYRNEYLSDPQRGLADLSVLANDPKFQTWLNAEENDDFDPLVSAFLGAASTREIDRLGKAVARRVAKFKQANKKSTGFDAPTSSPKTGGMTRKPPNVSEEEMASRLREAKRLARSRNPTDRKKAQELLSSVA